MEYEIIEIDKFSGNEATIYTIYLPDSNKTLFDKFVEENINSYKSELKDIFKRLKVIGHTTGARESYFKHHEGNPGDGVCALYDIPGKALRLYCIRYGSLILIIGGGGPKQTQKLQQDEKLKEENFILRQVVKDIEEKKKLGEIEISKDGTRLLGNLEFRNNEED